MNFLKGRDHRTFRLGYASREMSYMSCTEEYEQLTSNLGVPSATPDLRLPSQTKGTVVTYCPVLVFHPDNLRGPNGAPDQVCVSGQ